VVRPERIRLSDGPPAGGEAGGNVVAGRVEDCVFHGAFRRYRVRLPHGRVWSVDEPAGSGPHHPNGTTVWLAWRPEDCLAVVDGPSPSAG
jgi:ABC-type Fe3+/spermidine/putrescine transport system ATPase subunit